MLKSLFSGVSGLQSHQVAMDVESNNIANVNTVGFKYSRANFSDLLAQTKSIATAPQGQLGGKNPVQIGLGSTVSSQTRIFSQGSIQNSDKNTDVAIQGDGFFIISPDNGTTYKYTRAGDFKFDAEGNFVDNNGFIAQGWLRDPVTNKVDSTAPITSINIAPGLTTPAQATQEVALKANLNSGKYVESFSPAYEVASGSLTAIDNNVTVDSGNIGVMVNPTGEAFQLKENQGMWVSYNDSQVEGGTITGNTAGTAMSITFKVDPELNIPGDTITVDAEEGATSTESANNLAAAINVQSATTGISASVTNDKVTLINKNNLNSASHNISIDAASGNTGFTAGDGNITAERYQYVKSGANGASSSQQNTFTTMAELAKFMQDDARKIVSENSLNNNPLANDITVIVNEQGKFEFQNPKKDDDNADMSLSVTGYTDKRLATGVVESPLFTKNMSVLSTGLTAGSTRSAYSQSFNAPTHSSSIDVFDSLGSKHTLRMEFRKVSVNDSFSQWNTKITTPNGTSFDSGIPPHENEVNGNVKFSSNGALLDSSPSSVRFNPNNGAEGGQEINLSFGSIGAFDGMTSFDSSSSTSGISQDGFTGGDLVGIRIDQSGTLVGSFSNGRSFGLAQIAMAKFTNNEGLSTEGGNVYNQTANSGDPIIGTAATSGRGFIQSSALEASNVDLSRALTQLIIIQRGYQANGKTITTSDQMLQTLIGLKN